MTDRLRRSPLAAAGVLLAAGAGMTERATSLDNTDHRTAWTTRLYRHRWEAPELSLLSCAPSMHLEDHKRD